MHQALFLEEILRVIFAHCYPQRFSSRSEQGHSATDLVALASTCRVFKEPALDVLWTELSNLTPLARCLPGVFCSKSSEHGHLTYMFKRLLTATELDTVKRYTRRVLGLTVLIYPSLDRESLVDLCRASTTDPLFPNIRRLCFPIMDQTLPLIHDIAVPTLRWLHLQFMVSNVSSYEDFIHSLGPSCPNVQSVNLISLSGGLLAGFDEIMNRNIRCWTHLQTMNCSGVSLDIDTFSHLTRMPALTDLSFTLSYALTDQIASSHHVLIFSTLERMCITIKSTVPISKLFTYMRLPAITSLCILFQDMSPPRHVTRPFLRVLQKTCTHEFCLTFSVSPIFPLFSSLVIQNSEHPVLVLEDLRHFTALNLTSISINLNWIIDLKDSDLLELASDCQRLRSLVINDTFGWGTTGITPAGLAQLLRRCPLLESICMALDTRGYSHPPQIHASGGNSMLYPPTVNVADSVIDAESTTALAAFFADILPIDCRYFAVRSWETFWMRRRHQDWQAYMKRWEDVCTLAKQMALERSQRLTSVVESC